MAGIYFCQVMHRIDSTLPRWWPSCGPWDFSVCQHKDYTVPWPLDFVLLGRGKPLKQFSMQKINIFSLKLQVGEFYLVFARFRGHPPERAGLSRSLLFGLSKHRYVNYG